MICIIGAMEEEVSYLKENMKLEETLNRSSFTFFLGEIYSKKIVVVKSGIGKTAAAVCTQLAIDNFSPSVIINTGVAGALNSSYEIGEVVIGRDVLYHDVDVTAFGYEKNQIPGASTIFNSNEGLCLLAQKHGGKLGKIATGDIFVSEDSLKEKIFFQTKADLVDMESAAIAHTSTLNKIDFLIIRAVSDKAVNNSNVDFKKNLEIAVQSAIKITKEVIKSVR